MKCREKLDYLYITKTYAKKYSIKYTYYPAHYITIN